MKEKYYVTTAIAYPNSTPHLGHALEIIQADVIARFKRLQGFDVLFQTGTDEHGVKNWETAIKEGKEILEFLDGNVNVFKEMYKKLNITNDFFIRTSDKTLHYPGAQKLWKALVKSGDIYKKQYTGQYCAGCESFKTDKELIDGKCPDHPTREVQTVQEENYFFKLSKYKDIVGKIIEEDEYRIIPTKRKNEILSFIKEAKDVSFSRTKDSLPWGIPVPDDPDHVMYVWCDALSNYITGIGYGTGDKNFNRFWPADVHVIGKDILRFHAAIWPAMLISAKIQVPKSLFVHGHILLRGTKMSKSTGNTIEPFEQIGKYGVDQFRYYILSSMPIDGDGDYSENMVVDRINTELVGNLSNLCYRVLSFTYKNYDGKIGSCDKDPVINEITRRFTEVEEAFDAFDFKKAVEKTLEISALGNKYFQDNEPWKLIRINRARVLKILGTCVNIVKNLCILVSPIIPEFSEKLAKQLNVKNLTWNDLNFELKDHTFNKPDILFTKCVKKEAKKIVIKKIKHTVDPEVTELGVKVRIAQINGVKIKKKHEGLERLKKQVKENIFSDGKVLKEYETIDQKTGVDSSKNPNSVINLINLIKEKGQLPQINTAVDTYNVESIKNGISLATHDLSKIEGDISVRLSKQGEKFISLGNIIESLNKGEVIYADDEKVIGRFSKQCEETATTTDSQNIVLVAFGNKYISDEMMDEAVKEACNLIVRYNGGKFSQDSTEVDFSILDLKVAKITEAREHPDSEKLMMLAVDLGKEKRQLVAGLKGLYTQDELKGKNIVVVTNMKPATLRGEKSQGMLIAGEDKKENKMGLVVAPGSKPGDQVYVEGKSPSEKEIEFSDFLKVKMTVEDGKAVFSGKNLKTDKENITVERVKEGIIR
ncbi:MAG: methionine--tRNA ligase [Nanoarchaeota archaeon]|nr:methionine--tRNA ligase [Nanoarchaeota archaeon]